MRHHYDITSPLINQRPRLKMHVEFANVVANSLYEILILIGKSHELNKALAHVGWLTTAGA
jgi:hypothetical protein